MLFFKSGVESSSPHTRLRRRFKSVVELQQLLEKNCQESFEPADFLLIYDTNSQHTWLATSDQSLCCVIDLRREPDPKLVWQMPLCRFQKNGEMAIRIAAVEADDDTGYVRIEDQRRRKFSTSLFSAAELEEQIKQLLVKRLPHPAA
jgi:hypothetical protein